MKIGIIGGTGLDQDTELLTNKKEIVVGGTRFGDPSDKVLVSGFIKGIECIILGRHGKKHQISPSNVNYRANIVTLKEQGCTHILVTTACGSLKEEIAPGHLVIPDQYVDRTQGRRECTLSTVAHIPQNRPFNRRMQQLLQQSCASLSLPFHSNGVVVVIEGPRFSTVAESRLYKSWGCDIVNMTAVPEAQIAAEAGLIYASIALVTDYDGWHESEEEHVSVDLVEVRMKELGKKAKLVIADTIERMKEVDWAEDMAKAEGMAKGCVMCP